MSDIDPAKLKVVELRAELSARGLDTKGNKPVLVERLREAIEKERMEVEEDQDADEEEEEEEESEESGAEEGDTEESAPIVPEPAPVLKREPTPPPREPPPPPKEPTPPPKEPSSPPREPTPPPKEPTPPPKEPTSPLKESTPPPKEPTPPPKEPTPPPKEPTPPPKEPTPPLREPTPPLREPTPPPRKQKPSAKEATPPPKELTPPLREPTPPPKKSPVVAPVVRVKTEPEDKKIASVKIKKEADKKGKPSMPQPSPAKEERMTDVKAEPPENATDAKEPCVEEPMETDIKTEMEVKTERMIKKPPVFTNPDPSLLPKPGEQYSVMELSEWEDSPKPEGGTIFTPPERGGSRKRARSESPEADSVSSKKIVEDDEPDFDSDALLLSWYDSDLNLKIDKSDFLSAEPMHHEGFAYIWAGARASFGMTSGMVYYEVKITKYLDVSHLTNEESPHVVRIGWSIPTASMQLGEEALSFGYGGTGKVSCNNKFRDYGSQFKEGDVVTAYLDMSGSTIRMGYAVNGKYHGLAFEVPSDKLQNHPLFPHVITKNCRFTCNFGGSDPSFAPLEGYIPMASLSKEKLIAGPKRPSKKQDCEMVMMCGLPGSGKTVWAGMYAGKHPERNYNILGTNNLIDKMRVMGLSRRRNYHGRWDELIQQCTKCLNHLLTVAAGRRRNYILDQTNVYPSAQRRKMRPFEGFVRRAVVIVPTDEEFKRRVAQREQEEGKDVPDEAVMGMKGNFQLPVKGDPFDEVSYVELDETEARKLVETYNKEAADAGFGPASVNKRPRGNWNDDRNSRFSDRSGGGRYGGDRGDHRQRGGRGSGGGGGWRDHQGGNYRGRDGGGGGGWRGGNRDRDRGGDSRSRSDGYGGGRGGYDRNRSDRGGSDRRDRWGGSGSSGGSWSQGGGGGGGRSGSGYGSSYGSSSGGYGAQSGGYGQQSYAQGAYGTSGYYAQQQQQQQAYSGYGQQAYSGWGQPQAQTGYAAYPPQTSQTQQPAQPAAPQQTYGQYGYQHGSTYGGSTSHK